MPGSLKEKEIVIFVRRHWVSFLGQFLLSFLLVIIPIVIFIILFVLGYSRLFQGFIAHFVVLIISAYYLVVLTFAFVSWISFYYNVYIITRTEIIEITQIGFFGREIAQLPLLRVQDVTSSVKGFLPTFFSYGDVLVETASEQKEPSILCSVPNPQEIASKIMALHDEIIETEGRHHQILDGEGALAPGKISNQTPSFDEVPKEPIQEPKEKTPYQQLLEKPARNASQSDAGGEKLPSQEGSKEDSKENVKEGEISQDDLDKGGEIDLK